MGANPTRRAHRAVTTPADKTPTRHRLVGGLGGRLLRVWFVRWDVAGEQVSGAALRVQLVAPHGWGNPAGRVGIRPPILYSPCRGAGRECGAP